MCRYRSSTIYRHLDHQSTQIIQTHNPHSHNTTHPSRPWSKPSNHSPPTPARPPQPKHRHTSNTPPVPTGLVKPKPNPLIHSPRTSYTAPNQIHTHFTHSTNSSHPMYHNHLEHISCTRQNTGTTCTTHIRMSRTHHNHTSPVPHTSIAVILTPSNSLSIHTLSAYTHATQTTVHASHSPQPPQPPHPYRVPIQPHRQT